VETPSDRLSDCRISQKKLFGFRIWRIFYTDLRILSIQRIADLSNILARIVDLACNLVRILDCDGFIVKLLADSNLDKTIVGSRILLQIWANRRIFVYPYSPPPPPYNINIKTLKFRSSIYCDIFHKSKPNISTASLTSLPFYTLPSSIRSWYVWYGHDFFEAIMQFCE
jgi:hypothetical protein